MFYTPRTQANMQMPLVQQQMQGGMRQGTPMNSTTQMPQQQQNPLSSVSDASSMYKAGKGGMDLAQDAGNLYDRYTMATGVNNMGNVSPMFSQGAANANFLNAGATAMPVGATTGATFLGGTGAAAPAAGMGYGAIGTTATPWLDTAAGMGGADLIGGGALGGAATGADIMGGTALGADAAATGAAAAGTEAAALGAGAAAGETAAAGAGAIGAEAAGLGMLGPVGILAGAGLLGTKLFGLW